VSDSFAVVRNILMHIAAGVLVEETPPAAEALLVDEVSETLADLLEPASAAVERPATVGS
jgi:hypothetical protein